MQSLFDFLLLGAFFLGLFTLSMILAGIVRIEKRLKTISDDLKILSLLKK